MQTVLYLKSYWGFDGQTVLYLKSYWGFDDPKHNFKGCILTKHMKDIVTQSVGQNMI
jgi:hypothetical protein